MENIFSKLAPYYELFAEDDLAFIKNINSYRTNIEQDLQESVTRKEQIISYINDNDFQNSKEEFTSIDNTINDFNILKNSLENIEKNVIELALKSEKQYISNKMSSDIINNIKIDIINFNILNNKINNLGNFNSNVDKNFFGKIYKFDGETSNELTVTNYNDIDSLPIEDNLVLRISEKDNKVYLPYSKSEILDFLHSYPNIYKDYTHVINREYVTDLTFYNRHPVISRFRETYSLMRDREMKPIADSFKRSVDLMFKYELNPAIIAGLKSESQLDSYLDCIEKNDLDNFKPFKIIFEVNPI